MRRALPWTVAVVALAGAAWTAFSLGGRDADLRRRFEALDARYEGTRTAVERMLERERERGEAARVARRNQENLRRRALDLVEENVRLKAESRDIASLSADLERTRAEVERAASAADTRSRESHERVVRLEKDLARLRDEKTLAERREKEKQSALRRAQARMDDLVKELRAHEARREEYDEAVREYRDALEGSETALGALQEANTRVEALRRETATAHYNIGVLYARQGQHGEAAAEFERSLALNPNDPLAHYNLGLLHDAYLGSPRKAREHYEAYVRLLPKAEDARRIRERVFQLDLEERHGPGKDLRRNPG